MTQRSFQPLQSLPAVFATALVSIAVLLTAHAVPSTACSGAYNRLFFLSGTSDRYCSYKLSYKLFLCIC